ncbi:hypothetical protein I545_1688 [Mycobacterium kansasii 662]|uniref:Uncharacterized protein n=2 Tax=Mycobacterium kansasii TaxID=1768 RepID=A0A1V3XQ30_MYCKA|nr:hypothetical protein I547_3449 [Mycobacterium kansasii 824]EUA20128.1 hypothetical protein I545_1688 [Mycobacterium kansasii 662]KEP39698.1 hypothetical protein MKSMC1_51410 [Mycobacterium kansasii]OOK80611.1 hypothetical protein BZL29_2686 [Mycobacterium kansasii]
MAARMWSKSPASGSPTSRRVRSARRRGDRSRGVPHTVVDTYEHLLNIAPHPDCPGRP